MKRICKILALLFVVALTATATGYASEADTGYQPPTVVQTVMADMPVAQEYAFLGWDAGMAVTYADQQVCPNIVLQPVAGECPNDLWEWRCMAITDGHLNQGSFCRSVVAPAGPMLKFSPLYADMSVEYKTCIAANTGESVAFDIGRHSRILAGSENDAVPPGVKLRPTVRSGTGNAVRI